MSGAFEIVKEMTLLRIYLLALKYYLRDGDPWQKAVEYARAIVEGFKK